MLGHMHVLAECPELITPISWPVAANMYLKGRSARLLNDSGLDDEETVCLQTMVSCREPDSVTSSGLHREACTYCQSLQYTLCCQKYNNSNINRYTSLRQGKCQSKEDTNA